MDFVTAHTVRFIEQLNSLNALGGLRAYMETVTAGLGLRYFALYELGMEGKAVRSVHNFSCAWAHRYREGRYEYFDPVTIKITRTKQPFRWNSLGPEGYLHPKRSRDILFEAADFGLREGYTFPIVNTNGYTAVVSYATDRLDDDPRLVPAMQLISLYFHAKYKMLRSEGRSKPVPDLTPRERECLTWAGTGKTDWEIGEILSISEDTVHKHVENAKHKLGVTTRVQAVVESLRHHLIHV